MCGSQVSDIPLSMVSIMVYEENRMKTFKESGHWPYMEKGSCTPDKMAEAGFYWCGSESQPDLVRCFVCLKEFDNWDPDDHPTNEHKRLCPTCPFVKMGKPQGKCTVKEVLELCEKSLTKLLEKKSGQHVDQYMTRAKEVRQGLEQLQDQKNLETSDYTD